MAFRNHFALLCLKSHPSLAEYLYLLCGIMNVQCRTTLLYSAALHHCVMRHYTVYFML